MTLTFDVNSVGKCIFVKKVLKASGHEYKKEWKLGERKEMVFCYQNFYFEKNCSGDREKNF